MQLTPYIIFTGNCEEALNFYATALGAEVKDLMRFEGTPAEDKAIDPKRVMHAHLVFKGNTILMASDNGMGGPEGKHGGLVHLSINLKDTSDMERIFTAMSAGATVTMPVQDTFWGARFGMLTDRYGINWMFNCELKK